MKKNLYQKSCLLFLLLLNSLLLFANSADREITGIVTGTDDKPVAGVSIVLKGTSRGTTTDAAGKFSISVPDNGTLVFSATGYETTEITVGAQKTLDVRMTAVASSLEEVVVVGYGTQKKSDVTAAISTVNVKNLEKQPAGNLGTMLQGQVPGVVVSTGTGNPTGTPVILIRGLNSFNKQKPLYVIDGVPIDYANDLNPNDIETISVLKDASAATIYGARASAGVIIVTTKKGKSGEPRINYNGYVSSNKLANRISIMDKFQTNKVWKAIADNDGTTLPAYAADDTKYGNTDWQGAYFKRAFEQKHDVDVSAGSDKLTYRISYSHWANSGTIINSGSKRDNIRLTSNIKMLNSRLKITPILSYTRFNNKDFADVTGDGNAGFSDIMNIYAQLPHKLIYDPASPNGYAKAPADLGILGNGNPVGERMLSQNRTNNDYFQANVSADLKLWKGLSYTFTFAKTINNYFGYSQVQPYDFGAISFVEFPARSESRSRDDISVMTHLLNYELETGKHEIKALAGFSREEKVEKGTTAGGNHLYSQLNEVLSRLIITQPSDYIRAGGWNLTKRLQSYFGRLNYNYDNRYILQGSIRRDGSSNFGPLNRYGTFWSVSGGWAVHKESFFHSKIISELKPRVSYGTLGNEDIPPFLYLSGIAIGGERLNYPLGSLISQAISVGAIATSLGNNNIRWEQTGTFNAGVNIGLLDNKITASFDYFKSKTTGMLAPTPLPSTSGVTSIVTNVADMENKGWEFAVTYRHTAKNDFNFDVTANVSNSRNKILKLGTDDAKIIDGAVDYANKYTTVSQAGLPVASFNLFKTAGLFQSQEEIDAYKNKNGELYQPDAKPGDVKFVDTNNDDVIDDNDKVIMGSGLPKLDYGLNINASYKRFDLAVFFNGKAGQKMYNGAKIFLYSQVRSTDLLNAWTPDNKETGIYRATKEANDKRDVSDYFLENASFLRLRNIQLGYSFPSALVENLKLSRLRIYIGAYNLFTITKYSGLDPDLSNTSVFSRGVDRGYYPISKSFVAGINLGF
ncbi:MAG: SusC/RagA family TonB-linked outer membrane protein [Agriterribacter sp.]